MQQQQGPVAAGSLRLHGGEKSLSYAHWVDCLTDSRGSRACHCSAISHPVTIFQADFEFALQRTLTQRHRQLRAQDRLMSAGRGQKTPLRWCESEGILRYTADDSNGKYHNDFFTESLLPPLPPICLPHLPFLYQHRIALFVLLLPW
jgi:hypothetical protein